MNVDIRQINAGA